MTTPTPDEICERLRAVESAASEWHDGPTTCWHRNPDGPEAADLIQQQQARIEQLEEALRDISNAVRLGAESDLLAWANLADACQKTARTALKGNDSNGK